jgi:hypothetical protein
MITRHHVALAFLSSLILCSPFLFIAPLAVFILCAGTITGALLPDIHMTRPKKAGLRTLAWGLVQIPRKASSVFLYRLSVLCRFTVTSPADKRLTHSLFGILFFAVCACLILCVPVYLVIPSWTGDTVLFVAGLSLGLVLHLSEDLCTRKGIFPFFPFGQEKIAGSIRPCDRADPRIAWFHIQHVLVLLVLLVLSGTGLLVQSLAFPAGVAGLAACEGFMIYSADVEVVRNPAPAGLAPPADMPLPGHREFRN